jgi:hypothetical protein
MLVDGVEARAFWDTKIFVRERICDGAIERMCRASGARDVGRALRAGLNCAAPPALVSRWGTTLYVDSVSIRRHFRKRRSESDESIRPNGAPAVASCLAPAVARGNGVRLRRRPLQRRVGERCVGEGG